ncbi:pyridoxal phosphate-dependent aminotransferase [Microaerobacter geothermalis]|uniref:pyridoxal phosphate-dependent aminotransferase n=1 Tax=Microaerobacter geothermalis TaxID=674972 RepID=UPI001F2CAD73|nr:pyridoxal phosphate-dependent aminotransferase [Microaerobacter geothermalis]MCF6093333.1 pyridoxal phosphate-dependent aminotransferase [Microaerobacter geothermalis]
MELANRVAALTPSTTLAITAKAKELRSQGFDVVGLGAGEPDFNTPEHVIEAAYQAMKEGQTKYTPASGILELRKAICDKLLKDNQLSYTPDQISVGAGAKHVLYNIFQVIVNPGDEVIVPAPYWVSYPEMVKLAGGKPIIVTATEKNEFKLTPIQVKEAITERTKAIIINSPSNPTGSIYSAEELKAIAEVCIQHGVLMISDEIYEKLIYDGVSHVSIASLGEEEYKHTIVVNGVSKPYSMTGWRIGYAAGPTVLIKAMNNLISHSTSNATTFAQYGALAALTGTQEPLETMRKAFEKRRNRLVQLINEADSLSMVKPKGAFYAFINVKEAMEKGGYSSVDDWAKDLLDAEKVAVIPGSAFGAPQHIRISYATSMELLEKGVERIKKFIQQ